MAGGTLVVSRAVKNHAYYKQRFEELGFTNVTVTGMDNGGLDMLIRETKPDQLIMGSRFYQGATPVRMGEIRKRFPKLYMASVVIGDYPACLGMMFFENKINAYANSDDGVDLFRNAIQEIRKGNDYISPSAQEEIDKRRDLPDLTRNLTDKQKAVVLHICNGFEDDEVGDVMGISRRTVTTHKTDVYTKLGVRNQNELIRSAETNDIVQLKGVWFYPKNFVLNPLPEDELERREEKRMEKKRMRIAKK